MSINTLRVTGFCSVSNRRSNFDVGVAYRLVIAWFPVVVFNETYINVVNNTTAFCGLSMFFFESAILFVVDTTCFQYGLQYSADFNSTELLFTQHHFRPKHSFVSDTTADVNRISPNVNKILNSHHRKVYVLSTCFSATIDP